MNIREEIEHCIRSNPLNGFDTISEFGIDVLEDLFKKLAKQVCDKQKQICADNALMEQHTGQGKSLVNYIIGQDILHSKDELFISKHSIENSPYPEELQ